MTADDGYVYPFQSVVAYYYRALEAYWTTADDGDDDTDDDVLSTWLPPDLESASEAFYAWQAKSVQIYRDRGLLGFAHRFYDGVFGFLARSGDPGVCVQALDEIARLEGMLAHVGLSQAGVCGENDDGTTKFWQVNRIALLMIGDVVDAYDLIGAGLAVEVAVAPADRCILPVYPSTYPSTYPSPTTPIPCRIAFRDDAVTEAVVLAVPSSAMVSSTPVFHRAFTAGGIVAMPNGLDVVRTILRDQQLRAMFAIGVPQFSSEPFHGPTHVRVVGHRIGPAIAPSPILLPDERAWVDSMVGAYTDSCCRTVCDSSDTARVNDAIDAAPTIEVDAFGDADAPADAAGDAAIAWDAPQPDAPPDAAPDAAPPPDAACETMCIPQGVCHTTSTASGLVVMVSSVTTKECFGNCPEVSANAPPTAPSCAP